MPWNIVPDLTFIKCDRHLESFGDCLEEPRVASVTVQKNLVLVCVDDVRRVA